MTARRTTSQRAIDPRVVAGRYHSAYWDSDYTVDAITFGPNGFMKTITVTDADGTRTHATAWDERDRLLFDPRAARTQP